MTMPIRWRSVAVGLTAVVMVMTGQGPVSAAEPSPSSQPDPVVAALVRALPGDAALIGAVGDRLIFAAGDRRHGWELWRSDGTEKGTRMVKDIRPGPRSSLWPRDDPTISILPGSLLFLATDGRHGRELWRTDGTTAGTYLLADIWPGRRASGISVLGVVEGTAIFTAFDGRHGNEPWRSDGTRGGTYPLPEVVPGERGVRTSGAVVMGRDLYFTAGSPWGGLRTRRDRMLWNTEGAVPMSDNDLWRTDGTRPGTSRAADLSELGAGPHGGASVVGSARAHLFLTMRGRRGGLWSSDGTQHGTRLIDRSTEEGIVIGDRLVAARWALVNGSSRETVIATDGSGPDAIETILSHPEDATVIPAGTDHVGILSGPVEARRLQLSDGTGDGTTPELEVTGAAWEVAIAPVGARFLIAATREHDWSTPSTGAFLTVTDGTPEGTTCLLQAGEVSLLGSRTASAMLGTDLLLGVDEGAGMFLWATDGTAPGTRRISDAALGVTGDARSGPRVLQVGARVFYVAAATPGEAGRDGPWGLYLAAAEGMSGATPAPSC